MAIRLEPACPIMGAATGLQANEHRGQLRDKREQRLPGQTFLEYDVSRLIHTYQMKYPLCQVNPQYRHSLLHWSRLLLCGMMSPTLQSFWLIEAVLHRRVHYINPLQRARSTFSWGSFLSFFA